MKKLLLALFLIAFMWSASGTQSAYAGPIRVFEIRQRLEGGSGVTVSKVSGVSLVGTIDQKEFLGDGIVGIYSLTIPHNGRGNDGKSGVTYITFASAASSDPNGTGDSTTAGTTIQYLYIVTNTPKTATQIESLGVSGVTEIVSLPLNSGSSPFQIFTFTPEMGRYLHILVGTSSEPLNRPGAIVAIQ